MESDHSLLTTNPKTGALAEGQAAPQVTVREPLVRKVTFGDLADKSTLATVISLIKGAAPEVDTLPVHEWVSRLSSGKLEAFWVFAEQGQYTGLISFEVGVEDGMRILYVVSAAIAENVLTGAAWYRLFEYGRLLARERKCKYIEFDALPTNARMLQIGRLLGARESDSVISGAKMIRFTLEV